MYKLPSVIYLEISAAYEQVNLDASPLLGKLEHVIHPVQLAMATALYSNLELGTDMTLVRQRG